METAAELIDIGSSAVNFRLSRQHSPGDARLLTLDNA
jgi:hypothetical protein